MTLQEFQNDIRAGIPDRLPAAKPYDRQINHAPKRKEILTPEEQVLAIKNALRYFPAKHHAVLAKEFAEVHGDAYVNKDFDELKKAIVADALPKNIEGLQRDLGKYRIKYDVWFHESDLHSSGAVKAVVDKLLTGFDAPPATYLYIDKSMRDHGLFQAICRVNRLDGEDKEFGYIIDYKDLFRSLENAVADYTSEAFDCYDKEDVSGLLTDRLDKAKEQLEDSLEALRALCEPVAPPKDMVDYYHYFCGANTEAFDLDELEENMPKREQLYNLSATALRAFGEVSGELQEKYHYTVEQIKALEREVTYYIKVRDDVRLASGDYVDLKKYDPDMRHLIDTYLSADPSRVLTSFGGATLVELLVDNGISALKDMPSSTPKEQEAVAETIENNIGKEIVERTKSNPKYYEKMSALLRELIEKRKNDVINYEEYLRQIVELARKVHKPESGTEYPPEIRESAAKRAFYDHLNGDTVVANQIYDAVMSSKQDNFRGSKIKERKIWRAIRAVVKDDQEADQLLALVKEQSEF